MMKALRNRVAKILRYSRSEEYSRKYVVMNAFDGVMTVLGIILGSQLIGNGNPAGVLGAGIGASLAMGISGVSGTYMAEKAEHERKVKEIEEAMLKEIKGTVIGEAHMKAALINALVYALAALVAGLVVVSPYALTLIGVLSESAAFPASIATAFLLLFVLGVFLGRISGERLMVSGAKALGVGVATLILLMLLNLILPGA